LKQYSFYDDSIYNQIIPVVKRDHTVLLSQHVNYVKRTFIRIQAYLSTRYYVILQLYKSNLFCTHKVLKEGNNGPAWHFGALYARPTVQTK